MNKNITTVEIKSNSITLSTNKMLCGKAINLFNQTEYFNKSISTVDGVIIDFNAVKKTLNKMFFKLEKEVLFFEEVKDVICVVPSQTYSKKIFKKAADFEFLGKNNIFDDQSIEKNKNIIVKNIKPESFKEIINSEFMEILLDNNEWIEGTNQTGSKLSFVYSYEMIASEVIKSYNLLIKSLGKNIVKFIPNMIALFDVGDLNVKKPNKCIVTNWNQNNIELAYFSKGVLQNYKILSTGFNDVVERTASKLNISNDLCWNYLSKNIDFNSRNALESIVLKFNNSRSKKIFTGKQIRSIFLKEIDAILKQGLELLALDVSSDVYALPVFQYGEINSITNIEKIFKNKVSAANYFSKLPIIGSLNNYLLAASIGTLNLIVKAEKGNINSVIKNTNLYKNLQFDFMSTSDENGYLQALYLKQDGIIIDNIISSEGNLNGY